MTLENKIKKGKNTTVRRNVNHMIDLTFGPLGNIWMFACFGACLKTAVENYAQKWYLEWNNQGTMAAG